MKAYANVRSRFARLLRGNPRIKRAAAGAEDLLGMCRDSAASVRPGLIRPRPFVLMVAVTARCNARCLGCRYGRDFMAGSQLGWEMTRDLLDDAAAGGFSTVRLYGGEPLLHPDLPKMVEHSRRIGLLPYVTTNAVLLRKKFDDLHAAGLRDLSVGFYGVGSAYDAYVQHPGLFNKVEEGIAAAREKGGKGLRMQMNWLLMRPSGNPEALHAAYEFAVKYDMSFQVDLVHYSLPYFTQGLDQEIQFRPEDRPALESIAAELLKLRAADPDRIRHSPQGIRSIPDWLLLGPAMRVPCTANEMVWVGADGTVQMCYVTFKLGNLHEERLKEMLFGAGHKAAARDAFALNCPNCHCSANQRIMRHAPSRSKYGDDRILTTIGGLSEAPPRADS